MSVSGGWNGLPAQPRSPLKPRPRRVIAGRNEKTRIACLLAAAPSCRASAVAGSNLYVQTERIAWGRILAAFRDQCNRLQSPASYPGPPGLTHPSRSADQDSGALTRQACGFVII